MARTIHPNGNGKKKIGRPSQYKPEYAIQAKRIMTATGCTVPELGQALGISKSSIEKYMRDYPEFKSALKSGRDVYDTNRVERTCLQRALGFEYDEVTIKQITIKKGRGKNAIELPATETSMTKKFIPGDKTLLMFWLQNRHPDRWKNVQRSIIESTVKHTVEEKPFDYTKLDKKDLFAERDRLMKATAAQSRKDRDREKESKPEPVMN